MRKMLSIIMIVLSVFTLVFIFPGNEAKVSAKDGKRINERKFFTTYVVEKNDTLWDIAEEYITEEYDSIYEYIDEVMNSNHLESTSIKCGQLLILPYYADAPLDNRF